MAYFNLDTLQIGDEVATYVHRYGNTHVRLVKVVKVTKTTVSIKAQNDALPEVYNKRDGYQRGTSKNWYRKSLISKERYESIIECRRIESLERSKQDKRVELIKRLNAATFNDRAFAEALEALNQQEYAP